MTEPLDAAAVLLLRRVADDIERGAVLVTALRGADPALDEPGSPGLSLRWRAAGVSPVVDTVTPLDRPPRPLCEMCRSPRLIETSDGAVCQDCAHGQ